MRDCNGCGEKSKKGYTKNPQTGQESKQWFFCDKCFEDRLRRVIRIEGRKVPNAIFANH